MFIEGEGQCEAQSSRCVWQGPPTPENIPPLPGLFFLAVPFISSPAFQLCSVYASSRLVCVRLLFMPHRTVLPVAVPSAVGCGVPRGIGWTPAALGLPLGAGPCRLAMYQLGLVLLSVNQILTEGLPHAGPWCDVSAQGTAGSRTDALEAITRSITWSHYMVSW